MRVIIDMEIETPDYDGEKFKKEIETLIENIRLDAGDPKESLYLTKFKMRGKYEIPDQRSIDWKEQT